MTTSMPTPHLEKLNAAFANAKLPVPDKQRLEEALAVYRSWIQRMDECTGSPDEIIEHRVALLQEYKKFIDLNTIFDSTEDFLYRQKGQLKLDNSIIEEFIPWIFTPDIIPEISNHFQYGPTKCFGAAFFSTTLSSAGSQTGLSLRNKDQDFAISRKAYIRSSFDPATMPSPIEANIGYVACEIKTNLDKTMFQEACATARDLKVAVPSSAYFLLVEWLDMKPISTAQTDIGSVLLMRKAKRLGSDKRKSFSSYAGRQENREAFEKFLDDHPFDWQVFRRLVEMVRSILADEDPIEEDVMSKGFF